MNIIHFCRQIGQSPSKNYAMSRGKVFLIEGPWLWWDAFSRVVSQTNTGHLAGIGKLPALVGWYISISGWYYILPRIM